MKNILFLLSISAITLLVGCEEDINLTVASGKSKIVIDGNIENGKVAEVIVTRNSPLSQAVDFAKILVKDAKVYVSDGATTDTLTLDTLYTTAVPFAYVGHSLMGVVGATYYLTVVADGKVYKSSTYIPNPVPLDTVWWQHQPPHDSLGFAWTHFSEPAGLGNCYRWFAKKPMKFTTYNGVPIVLNRRFIAPLGSAFDDKYIDGKNFDFAYNRGYDATEATYTQDEPEEEQGYYKASDTIYIKFCTMNYDAYRFVSTYETAIQTSGNPFASPVSVLSNIDNDGLGVWVGYGASYDTIYPHP